jgi:predicted transcriptional regulator
MKRKKIAAALPEVINSRGATKKLIVSVLTREWPLSAKQIYARLNQGHGLGCTYQAVHKQLKEMEFMRILEKQERGYLISEEWLDKVSTFCQSVKEVYQKQRELTASLGLGENNYA